MITDYASLQLEVASWLNREDLDDARGTLTGAVQTFIQNAEGKFLRDPRVRDFANSSAQITRLSGANTTNWLLTSYPDIYLYGALVESAPFLKDDARVAVWKQELEERLNELGSSRIDPARSVTLTNYGGLKAAVSEYLNRADLKGIVPLFVTLAEKGLARDLAGAETITALSADADTNWVLTSHPDAYLYGSLVAAAPHLGQDERVGTWKALYTEAVEDARRVRTSTAYDLTTYAGLQTAVKGWLDRRDLEGAVVSFITLAEKKFQRDPRIKKLATATFSITADDISLPADFQSLESWYHDGTSYYGPIDIVDADTLPSVKARLGATGVPRYAALLGTTARFAPAPDTTYSTKMVYWQDLSALSAGVNWLFTAYPDVYLYGALVEAEPYLGKDPRVAMWKQMLESAIEEIRLHTWEHHFSGTMRRPHQVIG